MNSSTLLKQKILEATANKYCIRYVNDYNAVGQFIVDGINQAKADLNEISNFCSYVEIRKLSTNKLCEQFVNGSK